MKSTGKALSRNYNAEDLELYCQNRFYGPLVVAFNINKHPYYLLSFTLSDYMSLKQTNQICHQKNVKDDFVLEFLLNHKLLNQDLYT